MESFIQKNLIKRKDGFTIIELLVALGITAMLITLMVTITMSVLNAWNQSAANLTTENQARFVFNQLATDLEGMLFKQDGIIGLRQQYKEIKLLTLVVVQQQATQKLV